MYYTVYNVLYLTIYNIALIYTGTGYFILTSVLTTVIVKGIITVKNTSY